MARAASDSSPLATQPRAGLEGIPGDANQHERKVRLLARRGDFDGDGHGDLVVGSPYENAGGLADVGAETVLRGALFADGVENGDTRFWSQSVSSPFGTR